MIPINTEFDMIAAFGPVQANQAANFGYQSHPVGANFAAQKLTITCTNAIKTLVSGLMMAFALGYTLF